MHYAAKRFFAPVVISITLDPPNAMNGDDGRLLQVYVTSDLADAKAAGTVTVEAVAWKGALHGSGFRV